MAIKNNIEILAPVGNEEMLRAAVLSGADAVYFGMENFNARRNADNFTDEQVKNAIEYCHSRGVKVHITFNTLIKDTELKEAQETVRKICEYGADAIIIQDLGIAKMVHAMCPQIEMHASTQLSTGTVEGIKLLEKMGFTRAVLPRELNFNEIKELCENSPIELEMFVHGALCMSVSGQCLMSAVLGSRSGNRGLCAQPCRLPFKAENGTGRDLSLKDLSLIEHVKELSQLGICSFKIEGRMKRPEYVSATVSALKKSLNDKYTLQDEIDLKNLFSRSGFTKGYFENKLCRDMFGYREKENVVSATKELLGKYSSLYNKEKAKYKIDFEFFGETGKNATLKAFCEGKEITVSSDVLCEKPINRPISSERITDALKKCGGTQFEAQNIIIKDEPTYSLPISALNNMRRKALELLEKEISINGDREIFSAPIPTGVESNDEQLPYCRFDSSDQVPDGRRNYIAFVPIEDFSKLSNTKDCGVELPHGMFGNSQKVYEKLSKCEAEYVLCHTLDAVAIGLKCEKIVVASPSMNIINSLSMDMAKEIGISEVIISNECTLQNFANISSPISKGITVYGRIPLMLTRNCPIKNGKTCGECMRQSSLTDRKGISFPVRCRMGFSEILNSRPIYMGDRMREIPPNDILFFNFTTESKDEIKEILSAYENGDKPQGEFTRGLLYRGVI